MNGLTKTSFELKTWLESNSITKLLLPLDIIIMFISLGLLLLDGLAGGTFLGVLGSVTFYTFLFGLILCFANMKITFLYIGFFSYAVISFIKFIYWTLRSIINWKYFTLYYGPAIDIVIFAGIGLLILWKSGDLNKILYPHTNPPNSARQAPPSQEQK
ncbi:MAG TPA: hypothetical protein VHT34_10625 [Clostridia bacterium]|nr:hypothetical protein [Clostridia bacterium]